MRRYSFVQVDVFAARPLEGNPLAVFTDARGLSDVEMQALAREMNLSETTYILPREGEIERQCGVRVRIFTTEEELPFAGHPTLGTAMVLRALHSDGGSPSSVALDLKVGKIPVEFREDPDGQVFGEMRQRDPEFGQAHSPEEIAHLTGFRGDELDRSVPIQTVSTGVPFTVIPVAGLTSMRRLRLDMAKVSEYASRHDAKLLYFVTRETEDPVARLHARMIFSGGEDPATGSAAGCAAAWMARYGIARSDESVVIEQGIEAKRPSRIFVRAGVEGERVTNVRVGGYVAEVLRGEVRL
ncbi:MAG TPA: PhzF family phenazine biosynthesis protein [Terriglobia bacterium]|nr:PhzF family phenazine biosynthesis protein [Terriglobia bacterium]